MSASLPRNEDPFRESYEKILTSAFNPLRNAIKKHGDMFLFGDPTKDMMKLLMKIYHENIIRILSESTDGNTKPNAKMEKLKCMFGILEATDSDGKTQLYVTISESPTYDATRDSPTDLDFLKKRAMMVNLLKSANVELSFPEGFVDTKNRNADVKATYAKFPKPTILAGNLWRKGQLAGESENVFDSDKIRAKINENPDLKNVMLYNDNDKDAVNIYEPLIRDEKMAVNWVDSAEYLSRVRKGEPTFVPYKKYKLNSKTDTYFAECNNGHLCTESKLFGYAHLNNLTPKSFVAYWVGNEVPPENHIIRGYCYRTQLKEGENPKDVEYETKKLDELRKKCQIPLEGKLDKKISKTPNYDAMYKSMVQPIAVACPGCVANITAYKTGSMAKWDSTDCYFPRRHSKLVGGRRRHTTKKSKARKNKTHRHKKH